MSGVAYNVSVLLGIGLITGGVAGYSVRAGAIVAGVLILALTFYRMRLKPQTGR